MTGDDDINGRASPQTVPERPEWLDDEPEIVAILNGFLDKLDQVPISDRARMPSIRLNKKVAPRL